MAEETDNTAKSPPLRVGLVGLGRAALLDHLPALKSLPGLYQVTAACDLLKERRDIVERDFPDARMYRRVEDMLDDQEMDVVDIALPTSAHVDAALSSLRRAKWTVLESPIAVTHCDAKSLLAASTRAGGRLVAYTPEMFSPDFIVARSAAADHRLGDVFEVRVRRQDYVRRDDWQSIGRCDGGCAWYAGPGAVLQAMALLGARPTQLWSELRRVVSLGDAEDFAHIVLKTRAEATADIEICGAHFAPPEPSFTIRGSRGAFSVQPGAELGAMHVVDPAFAFPRRRSSVRTPPLDDMHERIPAMDMPVSLPPGAAHGPAAFWRALADTMRSAAPFPVALEDVVEAVRYLQIVKSSSPLVK